MHQQATLPGVGDGILSLAFSPNGKLLASDSSDNTIRLWDLEGKQTVRTLRAEHMEGVRALAFSHDGEQLLSAGQDKLLRLWNVATGEEVRQFKGHTTPVACVAISPDGTRAVSGGGAGKDDKAEDCALRLWNVATGEELLQLKGHTGAVFSLAYAPDGSRILSGAADGTLRWWDAVTGKEVRTVQAESPGSGVTHVAFAPDGLHALACGRAGVSLWDAAGGQKPLRSFPLPVQAPAVATFLPDNRRVLVSGGDTLLQWDTQSGEQLRPPVGHTGPVTSLVFSRDDRHLFSVGSDNWVRRWDPASGKDASNTALPGKPGYPPRLALSPDERSLLVVGYPTTYLVDVASGTKLRDLTVPNSNQSCAAFLDEHQALTGAGDGTVRLWNVDSGEKVESYKVQDNAVGPLILLADGKQFLFLDQNGTLHIWDRAGNKEDQKLPISFQVSLMALDSTNRFLYFGSHDGTVGMYDLNGKGARPITYHNLHQSRVYALALSPDGRTLATSDVKEHGILWDTAFLHGQGERQKLDGWQQPGGIHDLAFAHDSRHLTVGNGNGTIYILRLDRGTAKKP
jgi:WD40 repeat protein